MDEVVQQHNVVSGETSGEHVDGLADAVAEGLANAPIDDGKGLDRLRELVAFLKESEIAEFDLERPNLKLRLKFQGMGTHAAAPAGMDMAHLARLMAAQGVAGPIAHVAPVAASAAGAAAVESAPAVQNHIVKSPLVGTMYESPAPGAAPFVKVGDVVEVGQVLCIVEAMKLMNEIESDAAGEVVARITPSGQPVEFGQPLFEIKTS